MELLKIFFTKLIASVGVVAIMVGVPQKVGGPAPTILTPTCRAEIARKGAKARWDGPKEHDGMPIAYYAGVLNLVNTEVPCYVLSNGQRVIGRTALLEMLNGSQSGGDLEAYLSVQSFQQL